MGVRPNDPLFAALVTAGRELAATSGLVSLARWAAAAGAAAEVVKTRFVADARYRRVLEEAIGARCVYADGGCFPVKERTAPPWRAPRVHGAGSEDPDGCGPTPMRTRPGPPRPLARPPGRRGVAFPRRSGARA